MLRPGLAVGLLVALAVACASDTGSEGRPVGAAGAAGTGGTSGGPTGGAGGAAGSTGGTGAAAGSASGSAGSSGATASGGTSAGSGGVAAGGTAASGASTGSGGAAPDAGGAGGTDAAGGAAGDAATGLGEGAECYGDGTTGMLCAAGLFCDGRYDHCGSRGVCVARPLDCSAATPAPVCGCDGRVHSSACAAHLAGVDLGPGCAETDFPPGQFSCGPYFCDPATSYCHQGRGDVWDIYYECRQLPAPCLPGPPTCACLTLTGFATCNARSENGVDFLFVDEILQ